ncbi:MAG: 2-amino-4-hydroxy-6-hydroxymethyldihydropteridine diphosphokinase, partial [Kiritimatiellae bacterium]|nr:2-amino-4-hydroxy-6-hydroxymethyldihydropteridine diphosphokinase [Kiritimatiellia bacterium]
MLRAIVSLGSNIGERADYLRKAIEHLSELPKTRLIKVSSIIETEPVGVPEEFIEMKFLNQ